MTKHTVEFNLPLDQREFDSMIKSEEYKSALERINEYVGTLIHDGIKDNEEALVYIQTISNVVNN